MERQRHYDKLGRPDVEVDTQVRERPLGRNCVVTNGKRNVMTTCHVLSEALLGEIIDVEGFEARERLPI